MDDSTFAPVTLLLLQELRARVIIWLLVQGSARIRVRVGDLGLGLSLAFVTGAIIHSVDGVDDDMYKL